MSVKSIPAALLALFACLPVSPAYADHIFQFAPLTVSAPDSRAFANSTVGSPGLLSVGATVLDVNGLPRYNFLDTWQFTLNPGADLIAFVGSVNFTNASGAVTFGIDNLQINLAGPAGVVAPWASAIQFVGFQQMFSIVAQAPFQAGNYELRVRGLLVGPQSSYAGTLQAIAPVPLPAAWSLMAAGLVALRWHARRQRPASRAPWQRLRRALGAAA